MRPIALYRIMASQYPSTRPNEPLASPHELFTLLDFELRFLAILANSVLRTSEDLVAPKLGRAPGLGAWIAYLRLSREPLGQAGGASAKSVLEAVRLTLDAYDGGIEIGLGPMRVPKKLRDHLSHGGSLPVDADVAEPLRALLQVIDEAIDQTLLSAELATTKSEGITKASLLWAGETVELWPLVYSPKQGEWCLYSRFTNGARPSYFSFGTSTIQPSVIPDSAAGALNRVIEHSVPRRALDNYKADVVRDLRGFVENPQTDLMPIDQDQGFEIWWKKATGTGVGFEERRDYFRLGPDDRRQWSKSTRWETYSQYLREIANWPLTARRIRFSLEEWSKRLAEEESSSLGWRLHENIPYREAKIVVADLDGSYRVESTFSELLSSVDEDLQANRAQTQVVFINGEAGIGKTRAMVGAALRRATEIENASVEGKSNELPLLLYVGSTGQVLSQLDQVVAAAVSNTRSITADAVKALCRNGLMALLVDGFDELLGNVRYNDALGSLRPWLEDLGGRGVIVVSARSSYYVGQYKTSVRRSHDTSSLSVRHRIAEIQRWSQLEVKGALESYQVNPNVLERLSENDRELLGLPFFARAFIEICQTGASQISDDVPLTEHLLDQYLTREEAKIVNESGKSVISHAELKVMFSYVAELMEENSEREADDELLRTAAMFAINDSLESRGGLSERLPALCGLAVDPQAAVLRFRFQHELFFDQFLADAVLRYALESALHGRFHAMLGSSVWRAATIDRVASAIPGGQLEAILAKCFTVQDSDARREAAAVNIGSLWQAMFRSSGRMDYTVRNAKFIDPVDLSNAQPGVLNFVDSAVDILSLPHVKGWRIGLVGTPIAKLRAQSADFVGLFGVDSSVMTEIFLPTSLIERPHDIREALVTHGAGVIGPTASENVQAGSLFEAAEYFLRKAIDRGEYYWILGRNHRAPDGDLQVRKRTEDVYGRDVWHAFVRGLMESELAAEEAIAGSGPSKVRLRLTKNAGEILGRSGDDCRVSQFWALMTG